MLLDWDEDEHERLAEILFGDMVPDAVGSLQNDRLGQSVSLLIVLGRYLTSNETVPRNGT